MINDLALTSLETITAFDVVTGAYKFTLDELQKATLDNNEEKSEITGKHGRKLSNLKRNKSVTVSGENGLVSGGLLEIQTGGTFENKATEILWTDYLTVTSNSATTSFKAVGTTGSEIEELYLKNSDETLGSKLEQAATATTGKFAYNPTSKALTFEGIPDGTEIVVYYKRKIKGDVLSNDSDNYSGKCTLYIDALAEDKCANVYRVQIYIPKTDFSGAFSFEIGDSQTVHSFEAEALAGACGAGGNMWTYTVFGANAKDED